MFGGEVKSLEELGGGGVPGRVIIVQRHMYLHNAIPGIHWTSRVWTYLGRFLLLACCRRVSFENSNQQARCDSTQTITGASPR